MTTTASFGLFLTQALQRLADSFADRGASLRDLDERALADIGVDRSEIDSIEAESLGRIEVTRRRIAPVSHG